MADYHVPEESGKTLARGISQDIYAEVKNWIVSQDPTGAKLLKYQEGIKKALGHVQIMGMASPRQLDNLYIALRATSAIGRERPLKHSDERIDGENILKEIRQLQDTPKGSGEDEDLRKEIRNVPDSSPSVSTEARLLKEIRHIQNSRSQLNINEAIHSIGYDFSDDDDDDDEYDQEDDSSLDSSEEKSSYNKFHDRAKHGVDALTLVEEHKHLVVLGQPGSGKTTFLKYLALGYFGFARVPIELKPCIPIFVPLRELSRVDRPSPTAKWLVDFAANCASDVFDEPFSAAWLRRKFSNGDCILLLDGVDEVPTDHVGTVLQSIMAFRNKYGNNKIVVTCRSAAFKYGLEGFQLCEVDNFNDEDIRNFASHWFNDNHSSLQFISDIFDGKSSKDICRTPLLLTLLCIQYDYYRSIPRNRSELYSTCIDALMFRWDTYRAIRRPNLSEKLSPDRKKRLLINLARDSFDRDVYFFDRNTLIKYLDSELHKYDLNNIDAGQVLDELESHHGILIERASNLHCFAHLTFHEFFCALAYAAQNDLDKLFHKAVNDHRYREVFLLALEHVFDPDKWVFGLAALVKRKCIDGREDSRYLSQMIDDVASANIPMSRQLRRLLREIRIDLDMPHTR